MSLILHMGVHEIPYNEPAARVTKAAKGRKARPRKGSSTVTTGDVATILEAKYHVMETFYEENEEEIGETFAHGMGVALEDLFMGAPPRNPFAEIDQEITDGFKTWLSLGLIEDAGVPGVPTKAALERRSLRFKAKRGPNQRPSFIDTGAYEGSFTAWVERT